MCVSGGIGGNAGKGPAYTEPSLPPHEIVKENGVIIDQNYRSNDHGPAHLHVQGRGPDTRIGEMGHPLAGDPELSRVQRAVVDRNIAVIKRAVRKIGRWLRYQQDIDE